MQNHVTLIATHGGQSQGPPEIHFSEINLPDPKNYRKEHNPCITVDVYEDALLAQLSILEACTSEPLIPVKRDLNAFHDF